LLLIYKSWIFFL